MIGQRFGRYVVVAEKGKDSRHRRLVERLCDCGIVKTIDASRLTGGYTKSCGCYKRDKARDDSTTHGGTDTRTYHVWMSMRSRCNNPRNAAWERYGGRGITVCPEWNESFARFLSDMGESPKGMDIDRMDNDKGYTPDNCHWVTRTQNSRNRHNSTFLTCNGITKHIREWASLLGVSPNTLHARKAKGWVDDRIINTPVRQQSNSWIDGAAQS